jgi:hypothetical protein
VNADPGTSDQWGPVLAVAPDGSRLFVSWYDRRNDAANSRFDLYAAVGTVAGSTVTLGPNFILNDAPIPTVVGQDPALPPDYMGDYDGARPRRPTSCGRGRQPRASPSHTKQPCASRIALRASIVSGQRARRPGGNAMRCSTLECASRHPIENAGIGDGIITGALRRDPRRRRLGGLVGHLTWGLALPSCLSLVPALSAAPVDLQLTLSSEATFRVSVRVPGIGTGTPQRVDFLWQSIPMRMPPARVPFTVTGSNGRQGDPLLYLTHS